MGKVLTPVSFWDSDIVLDVHTATNADHIGQHTLDKICSGRPASLYSVDNGDHHLELPNGEFMTGPMITD